MKCRGQRCHNPSVNQTVLLRQTCSGGAGNRDYARFNGLEYRAQGSHQPLLPKTVSDSCHASTPNSHQMAIPSMTQCED
jgi:hypothetical protein